MFVLTAHVFIQINLRVSGNVLGSLRGFGILSDRDKNDQSRAPNPPLQSTPLRVDKIGAFLRARIGYSAISIYGAARLNGKPLGCP